MAAAIEGLLPHPNLEILNIWVIPGLKLPKWVGSSSCLPNLVELRLVNCNSCRNLEGLGHLQCLRVLISCLGIEEFYYQQEDEGNKGSADTTTFTNQIDHFWDNLEEWAVPSPPHNCFPCLEEIRIHWCSNLTSIPDLRLWTALPFVQYLWVDPDFGDCDDDDSNN